MLIPVTHQPIRLYKEQAKAAHPEMNWGERQTLAFCFLTVNGVVFTDVWDRFFQLADQSNLSYEIYVYIKPSSIHKNGNGGSRRFCNYIVDAPETSWAKSVRGQRALWRAAANGQANKVVLLSESCIPTQHPLDVWRNLGYPDKSLIMAVDSNNGNNPLVKSICGRAYDIFHSQFCVIDRAHFEAVDNQELNDAYDAVTKLQGDNETYTLAALLMAGKDGQWLMKQYHHVRWTHTIYPYTYVTQYKEMDMTRLRSAYQAIFEIHTGKEINYFTDPIRQCLFARKFHPDWDQQILIDLFLPSEPCLREIVGRNVTMKPKEPYIYKLKPIA